MEDRIMDLKFGDIQETALIPLAINGSAPGNEIQSPMAQVILGGLVSSTVLNAFVIPIVYILMNRKNEKA